MSTTYSQIPSNWNVPGSNTQLTFTSPSGSYPVPVRFLVLGRQPGNAAPQLYPNVTPQTATTLFGSGSTVAIAVAALASVFPGAPVDALGVQQDNGATASTITVTFDGTATGSGNAAVMIGGQRIAVPVSSGTAAADVATAFASAIEGTQSAFTAATGVGAPNVNGTTVTLTSVEATQYANDIDARVSPLAQDGVAGITITAVNSGNGTGAASVAPSLALSGVQNTEYSDIIATTNDISNLQALAQEADRRSNAMVQQDVRIWASLRGTYAQVLAISAELNDDWVQILPAQNAMWHPAACAAAFGGAAAVSLIADPSRQLRGIALAPLAGLAPVKSDLYPDAQKSVLLGSGLSTFTVDTGGNVYLQRVVVTTQSDPVTGIALGRPRDVMVPAIGSRVRYAWNAYVEETYPDAKLADDGSGLEGIPGVLTPSTMGGDWVGFYTMLQNTYGWVQDAGTVAPLSTFAINLDDPNQMDSQLVIKCMGAFIRLDNALQVQG